MPVHPEDRSDEACVDVRRSVVNIGVRRLRVQQISRHDFTTPRDVVAWLGAVQAQDWAGSKWAIGLRLPAGVATDETIEKAVDDGELVRTHALRWTWQIMAPEDVRWVIALVAPRLVEKAARRHRELELDAATIRKSNAAIVNAMRDGAHLTRREIAGVLTRAGISGAGQRLAHLLGLAELDALVCSGRRRGKQPTWALLDGRVPMASPVDRRDALAALARRYFRSRGPATVDDFRWWSGLGASDARAGLESVAHTLTSHVVGGRVYWLDPSSGSTLAPRSLAAPRSAGAQLLPAYDEYLVAYRNRDAVLAPQHAMRFNAGGGLLAPCIVYVGIVIGTWRRTLVGTARSAPMARTGRQAQMARPARLAVTIEHDFFARASAQERRAVATTTQEYAAFIGRANAP